MKQTNEALQTVRRHGVEHVLFCLGVKPDELRAIRQDDPELYQRIVSVRNAMSRQLARNTRNASSD